MTNPAGPVFAGGRFEEFVLNQDGEDYTILFLPDLKNDDLQREGKSAYYYYVPESVRLARQGDRGDFKFHHTHFVGTFSEDTHVGLGNAEVVGGALAFTTTSRYPTAVMQKAADQLRARFQGSNAKYWGLRSQAPPQIAVCPIVANITEVSNLSPDASGAAPGQATGGAPSSTGGSTLPDGAQPAPAAGGPRNRIPVREARLPARVPHGEMFRAPSNLDAWAWRLQGQGPGSITGGENAYAGLIGALPSEIVWSAFHTAYSPIFVKQNLQLAVWSELLHLKITGNWDRIFEHFSAAAHVSNWWWTADLKAEFNNLRYSGGIQVELSIDGTQPDAAKREEEINKRIDLIFNKFMEQAQKIIFEPAPPTVEPAQASGGGFLGWGGGVGLKYRRDSTHLNLTYEETRNQRYLQPHTISSSFQGFFNEIKRDAAAERKYFTRLVLGDLSRKLTRVSSPQINWTGDPVGAVSCQIGYPDARGQIQWTGHLFQTSDPWTAAIAQRNLDEVANPPASWTPDKTFVKRTIHFKEPPRESDAPYSHVFVEKPDVELDPQPNGSVGNDHDLIVRLADAGLLDVGPMALNIGLEDATQQVDVEFKAAGTTQAGRERAITRFTWKASDQDQPRFWKIYTGQKDYVPLYQYRVTCIVKGSFFSKGQTWVGPWVDGAGNGPLTVAVPSPDDAGVTRRSLTVREMFSDEPISVDGVTPTPTPAPPTPVPTSGPGAPPMGAPVPQPHGDGAVPGAPPSERGSDEQSGRVSGYDLQRQSEDLVGPPPAQATSGARVAPSDGGGAGPGTNGHRDEQTEELELAAGFQPR